MEHRELFTISESDTEFLILAALRGIEPQGIKIEVTESSLVLTAERPDSALPHYRVTYTFPALVQPGQACAELREGILELHLPRQHAVDTAIAILVMTGDTIAAATSLSQAQDPIAPPAPKPNGREGHEGHPAGKMGANYTPTAAEDHVAQARSIGARTQMREQASTEEIALAISGKTNPLEPPAAPSDSL